MLLSMQVNYNISNRHFQYAHRNECVESNQMTKQWFRHKCGGKGGTCEKCCFEILLHWRQHDLR